MGTPGNLIPRDPEAETRTRRALGQVVTLLNGLITNGDVEIGPGGLWQISPSAGGRSAPAVPPALYLDETEGMSFPIPGPKGDPGDAGPAGPPGSGGGGGGSGAGASVFLPDAPPESAGASDDEFDDGTLGAAWTDWDAGAVMTYSEGAYGAKMVQTGTSGDSVAGIHRAVPAGDFAVVTKVQLAGLGTNFTQAGIFVGANLSANPSTAAIRFWGVLYQNTNDFNVRVLAYTNYASFGTDLMSSSIKGHNSLYFRIRRISTALYYDYSTDGLNWVQAFTESEPYTLVRMGVCVNNSGHLGALAATAYFRFFRQQASTSLDTPLQGRASFLQGPQGAMGPFVLPEEPEPAVPVPGERGPAGVAGANGTNGAAGPTVFVLPEEPESAIPVPGERGPVGTSGTSGATGPQGSIVFVLPEEPEPAVPVPGERGPAGVNGTNGTNGTNGLNGAPGTPGLQGDPGPAGAAGPAGPAVFVIPEEPEFQGSVPFSLPVDIRQEANFGGRLTLTSGVPVTTSDVIGATTVYLTPYLHNLCKLWDGGNWVTVAYAETALALGTVTSGIPYDVFAFLSGTTLALERLAWTNTTTRATGISLQDGRYCKTGDKTRLYLGTFHTTSTTATEDSATKRLLWNMYNRVPRPLLKTESADSWVYSTAAYRAANGSTANRFEAVRGLEFEPAKASVSVLSNAAGATSTLAVGVAVDSVVGGTSTTNSASVFGTNTPLSSFNQVQCQYAGHPGIGYRYYQWLEYSSGGTTTWYGDAGLPTVFSSGIIGEVFA